ncbi:class I SAM-dependent methyltransferase [Lentzea sp. NPDC004782]|uniref:O-methyltransferase n=1 Tax=Lentzea sp. NPDC004782 TaxID=3154458 RepID=UPI0033B45131
MLEYALTCTEQPVPAQRRLIDATAALGQVSEMQVVHGQAVFLTVLTAAIGARTVIEIGTFTGDSALAFARGLAPGGVVDTYNVTDEWSQIASRAWREAGVTDLIRQHIGNAADLLDELPQESFVNIAFIDADKVGYITYWEQLVPRMVDNGLILADNVLYYGDAVSPEAEGNAAAIRAFNEHVMADDRVQPTMLPLADGLTIARKLPRPN